MRVTFLNLDSIAATSWENARGMLRDELERLKATINTTWVVAHNVDGTQTTGSLGDGAFIHGTLAEQPTTLDASNDGLLFYVNDYGHVVRYNASLNAWEFAPGDSGSGYFADFAITPQAPGWALCDGSTISYLVVGGAALATANITLPNLTGTPAYRKSAAAYAAAIVAAGGSTGTGTTGAGGDHDHGASTGSNNPGTSSNGAHTHTYSGTTSGPDTAAPVFAAGALNNPASNTHTHTYSGTTSSDGAHTHTVDSHAHSISASGTHTHSAPALGIGTLDPAHLNVLPYFRR